jgi:hypothetical protein
MALTSPGVEVTVIDESFYTPAAPGTVPMIFVASAQNKSNGSGTGVAPGTLAANAGNPYLLTSQRELVETFGDPIFYTDANNNPINGGELNEYGLQAAYSLLGVSSRVYVTRADIDLGSLQPQAEEPGAAPDNGTNWLDTQITQWGIAEWNGEPASTADGQTFSNQTPIVITDSTQLVGNQATGAPKASVGAIGQYAVKATTNKFTVYVKDNTGEWQLVGSPEWKDSVPFLVGGTPGGGSDLGNGNDEIILTVGGTSYTLSEVASGDVDAHVQAFNTTLTGSGVRVFNDNGRVAFYNDGSVADFVTFGAGLLFGEDKLNITEVSTGDVYYAPSLQISPHTDVPLYRTADNDRPTGSVWIKSTEPNLGARWRYFRYNSDVELFDTVEAPLFATNAEALYSLDRAGGGINLAQGTTFVRYNSEGETPAQAEFKIFSRTTFGPTTIVSKPVTDVLDPGSVTITIYETQIGERAVSSGTPVVITLAGTADDADTIAGAINSAGFENVVASVDNQNRIVITHEQGGDIRFGDGTDDTSGVMGDVGFVPFNPDNVAATTRNFYLVSGNNPGEFIASNWAEADVIAQDDPPQNLAADGELWYNSVVDEVDIMVHDGSTWVGYRTEFPDTDPAGPIVSAGEPTQRSDGAQFVDGDIWIDTSDIENYPTIYRFSGPASRFVLVDKTDQTSDAGILFADARYGTDGGDVNTPPSGTITEMLQSDFLDPDAPDPALYPRGMLLYNLRRSGFNVKRFERGYIDTTLDNDRFNGEAMANYYPDRWVTESRNQNDGSGSFGAAAQRIVVVQSLQAMVNSNDQIRDDESRVFNVMATPNYPELIGEMITLNFDRGISAFIVGDSPMTLRPDATSLNEWGQNVRNAVEDNKQGLVSFDEYMGVYYPAGFTSDNLGNNVVVPPSHMALRTIALSDQVSYPWFAPAGTRRGGVTNATSSGYINSEGEFVSVSLNEGQRNTLYANSVNPITFLNGAGLVVFGQKTRARNASSLDRINVARLVIYLRSQLNRLAKPYLFEPNDKITRDEIKGAVESLMLELVGQRALYDYIVVCDETNNTPARIDRNELYVDVAVEPVKAIEFIYIPLRLKNTGEIAGL